MNFLQRIMASLQRFMSGRYSGGDPLNMFLITIYLLLAILQLFVHHLALYFVSLPFVIFFLFRILSKNIAARQRENAKYLELSQPIRKWIHKYIRRIRDRRIYKYFSCPGCHRELRVPRGRSEIEITCPHCHHHFKAKS